MDVDGLELEASALGRFGRQELVQCPLDHEVGEAVHLALLVGEGARRVVGGVGAAYAAGHDDPDEAVTVAT